MKQAIKKSPISRAKCYRMNNLEAPHFDPHWHFHQEYQLVVVLKGSGTRFIGNDIRHFESGDMVLTGANLPHVWRNDEEYFQNLGLKTRCVVIYFSLDFMGDGFLSKDEMEGISNLLEKANRGLEVTNETRDSIQEMMVSMLKQNGFDGVLSLLQILNKLANSDQLKYINKKGYLNKVSDSDSKRMSAIHSFILNNYRGTIRLNDVAQLANLSPTSFSRYFKVHTNKTFSDFVAELRISTACKLLHRNDLSIIQIAHECGYKTLSNFNKKFKEITDSNPLNYRKKYEKIG